MQALMIASTLNVLSNFAPIPCPILELCHDELVVLLPGPVALNDVGVEYDVPSLVALLLGPAADVLGNSSPILCSVELNSLPQLFVLFFSPVTLHEHGVCHLLPPILALVWGSVLHHLGDLDPVRCAPGFNSLP